MKIFIHSKANPENRREIDTYTVGFNVAQSRFYMELGAPYVIHAASQHIPTHFELSPNGTHVFFNEESIASEFFSWLKNANEDANERFNQAID